MEAEATPLVSALGLQADTPAVIPPPAPCHSFSGRHGGAQVHVVCFGEQPQQLVPAMPLPCSQCFLPFPSMPFSPRLLGVLVLAQSTECHHGEAEQQALQALQRCWSASTAATAHAPRTVGHTHGDTPPPAFAFDPALSPPGPRPLPLQASARRRGWTTWARCPRRSPPTSPCRPLSQTL